MCSTPTSTPTATSTSKFYTPQEDHALMDQVVVYNPFKKTHSWEVLRQQLSRHPTLHRRTAKSLRDRTHLLMGERKSHVQEQERASGIEEPPRTDYEVAVDEALLLKKEEEEAASACKRPAASATTTADQKIVDAADKGRAKAAVTGAGAPPAAKAPRQASGARSIDLVEVLKVKIEIEKEARLEAEKKKEERKAADRADAAEERQLRREELDLRKRELALKEKQEAEASRERQLLINFLIDKK